MTFRTSASAYDYKNLIADYKGHNGRLKKLLQAWSANAGAYVMRALEFEAEQARRARACGAAMAAVWLFANAHDDAC